MIATISNMLIESHLSLISQWQDMIAARSVTITENNCEAFANSHATLIKSFVEILTLASKLQMLSQEQLNAIFGKFHATTSSESQLAQLQASEKTKDALIQQLEAENATLKANFNTASQQLQAIYAAANPTPATAANPTPATAANPTPATAANPTPATAANPTPATAANPTPATPQEANGATATK